MDNNMDYGSTVQKNPQDYGDTMNRYRKGSLMSGSGRMVTNKSQANAIGQDIDARKRALGRVMGEG